MHSSATPDIQREIWVAPSAVEPIGWVEFVGERFGKFRLERKLAVGGMAEIFLATQQGPEGFKKHVAIKRILPHLTDDSDFVTMFLDEARLVARFNHPNIVQIFELGEVDGRYFLAMEFVNGVSMSKLSKVCRKSEIALPLEYGAKIVSFACEGLDYAHSFTDADGTPLCLIHRDVSPQNLMLSYDGVVKVLDFGIAKAVGNVYQTRTSSLKGKAAYMSPEQITQKSGLDRRSDIFSLGIALFEFATGRRPFDGDTELELMMSIVKRQAPDSRQFNEAIPDEMAEIIACALEKNRENRFQSCRELRQRLEEFLINRRMMVDNYTLGAFAREVIPPGDTGVGYAVATPSRPSQLGAIPDPTDPARLTPSSRRPRPQLQEVDDDAPTQLTPSAQLRPLVEGADPADEPIARPETAQTGAGGKRAFLLVVVVLLVAAIGAGVAFLLFGGELPDQRKANGAGMHVAGSGPVAADPVRVVPDAGPQPGVPVESALEAPSLDAGSGGSGDEASGNGDAERFAGLVLDAQDPPAEVKDPKPNRKKRKKDRRRIRRKTATTPKPTKPVKPDAGVRVAAVEKDGKLVVDTRPWTNVSIDGTAYGTTPVGPVDLRPGVHKVVLSNRAKGIKLSRTIRILPGQTQRVQEKFGQGLLQVFVKPFGEVFVNGISKGMTPLGAPIKLHEGSHSVKVVCNRTGKQETKPVRVKAGQTLKLIFDLR